ncbi:MAG: YolD-like family protein [Lachnospiraceae bacterium]|nr:YolD-like family protein [Lachnospiraceae bacterium]
MPKRPRTKMSREDRAKQFMPFAALKGFEEELEKKEKMIVEKVELSEERKEELDRAFSQIKKRDMVEVIYYKDGEYLQLKGMVSRIDAEGGSLTVVNTKIPFSDLYNIEKIASFPKP